MNLNYLLWALFLVFHRIDAFPAEGEIALSTENDDAAFKGKIREKRKDDTLTTAEVKVPGVEILADEVPKPTVETTKLDEKPDISPALFDTNSVAEDGTERFKKQAYMQQPLMLASHPEVLYLRDDSDYLSRGGMPLKSVPRTIEPFINYSPLSLMGFSSPELSHSTGNSLIPQHAFSLLEPQPYQFPSYHHHRHPMIRQPYYSLPSPYGGNEEASAEVPMQLFCQPLRNIDASKALPLQDPVVPEKKNDTDNENLDVGKHVAKINQMKDEITELNKAAQRIVQQQEEMARNHEEHLARRMPTYPRHPQYGYGYGYPYHNFPRPYGFRSDEGETGEGCSTPKPSEERSFFKKPTLQYYSLPPKWRSETGFDVPSLFKSPEPAPAPISPADVDFFLRFLNVGKQMGVIPKDIHPRVIPPNTEEKASEDNKVHRTEDTLTDLMYGENQKKKTDTADVPTHKSLPTKELGPKKSRRDSRGLVV